LGWKGSDLLQEMASIATALGVLVAVYQLRLARKQARASFEQEFVNRCWSIEDDRLRDEPQLAEINKGRYLRLCEDEMKLMRLGQVSWWAWEVWHDGIRHGVAPIVSESGSFPVLDAYRWLAVCHGASEHRGSTVRRYSHPTRGTPTPLFVRVSHPRAHR
jgi:hypothetical protein